jgi:ribonuclease HI|tara:strand:- start:653 stop:1243 length:591 start_codon:yes stop_codon:yes gene_type:complete
MNSKLSKKETESLEALLERLNIEKWDLLLVGDGSGSNWNFECGWGCVSIHRDTLARKAWYGAMNSGTVNFAEIMAYIQPLTWYTSREQQLRKKGLGSKFRNVHIVTDSRYVQSTGDRPGKGPSLKNSALWQMFKSFPAHGILLHWHWIRRDTVELNQFSDRLSKDARLTLKRQDLQTQVEERSTPTRSIYEFNPAE